MASYVKAEYVFILNMRSLQRQSADTLAIGIDSCRSGSDQNDNRDSRKHDYLTAGEQEI